MTAHMQMDAKLYALGAHLNGIAGLDAVLRDNVLTVTRGDRTERITCAPRPSDFDRPWFWDSQRKPVAEADRIIDASVTINGRLQGGAS
jgi:hypothetical protein